MINIFIKMDSFIKITKRRAGAGCLQQCLGPLLARHLPSAAIPQYGVDRVPGSRHRRSDALEPRQLGKWVGEWLDGRRHDVMVPRRPSSRRAGIVIGPPRI